MSRRMNLGSWMISVCLFTTSVGVQAQQTTTPQDKSQGQAQRSVASDPEMPRGGPDAGPAQNVAVPRLVKFSSTAKDQLGHAPTSVVGVTFAIYKEQEGGAALWIETQNVQLDEQGHYAVLLGATKNDGLPVELFAAAEPRWLGVQLNLPGEVEQPRVLLVSVPYALKAADAESLGGKPASSYALAPTGIATGTDNGGTGTGGSAPSTGTQAGTGKKSTRAGATPAVVTTNFIPLFTDNAGTLGNSLLVQSGNSIGLGQGAGANATVQFDVNGGVRGTGLATAGRSVAPDAINTNALFLNGSNAMGVIGASNVAFAPGALFTKTSFYSGGVERMTVDGATGNVGIGTTTPVFPLHVSRIDSTSTGLQFRGTNGSTATNSFATFSAEANGGAVVSQYAVDGLGTGPLGNPGGYFGTFTGHPLAAVTGNVERMRITAAGNVGIGTKTPSALLSLSQTNGSSTVTATPIQSITNLVDASASASLAEPFSTWRIGVNRPPDNNAFLDGLFFYDQTNNATRMAITFGGNVGIGTTTPTATLEVKVGGTTLADAWTVRSSRRWKINIEPLKGALKKVDQLRGVSYDRKTDGKHEIGVVAEEVGKVVPEVVTYEKNGVDAQGVDYARLTALLIEATKEQHQTIEKQQAQIDALARSSREKDARIRKLALQIQELRRVQQMASLKTRLGRVEVRGGGNQDSVATHEAPPRNPAGAQ